MKKTVIYLSVFAFLFSLTAFTTSDVGVDMGKWVKLGSRKVNYGLDRDVIHVGLDEGGFTKLKIQVVRGSLNMHKVIVEYRNGTQDVLPIKHQFARGQDSRVIDLEGGKRIIKDITFWYDTKNLSRNKARVVVFGRK